MVLSKVQDGGESSVPVNNVLAFLREFKPLECSCCDQILGFQHRVTGAIFCEPHCPANKETSKVSNNAVVKETSKVSNNAVVKETFQDSYDAVVKETSKDSYNAVVKETFKDSNNAVVKETSKDSYDAVDNRTSIRSEPLHVHEEEPVQAQAPLKQAESIRKDMNPFFKTVLSSKPSISSPFVMATPRNDVVPPKKEVLPPPRVEKIIEEAATAPRRAPQVREKLVPVVPKPKYSWLNSKFSPNLENGVSAKVTFVWGLNKYQVCAVEDEAPVMEIQETIAKYVSDYPDRVLKRKPLVNEIVLGLYGGEEYYRSRVTEVREKDCTVVFVDFGDSATNTFDELFEIDETIFEIPIFSITLGLLGVPHSIPNIKTPKTVNKIVFGDLKLELIDKLKPTEALQIDGKLWYNDSETINDLVLEVLHSNPVVDPKANKAEEMIQTLIWPIKLSSIIVDGVTQYSSEIHDWLSKNMCPGKRVKVRVVHTVEDLTLVRLVDISWIDKKIEMLKEKETAEKEKVEKIHKGINDIIQTIPMEEEETRLDALGKLMQPYFEEDLQQKYQIKGLDEVNKSKFGGHSSYQFLVSD